jgi:hypothetical protein
MLLLTLLVYTTYNCLQTWYTVYYNTVQLYSSLLYVDNLNMYVLAPIGLDPG